MRWQNEMYSMLEETNIKTDDLWSKLKENSFKKF